MDIFVIYSLFSHHRAASCEQLAGKQRVSPSLITESSNSRLGQQYVQSLSSVWRAEIVCASRKH